MSKMQVEPIDRTRYRMSCEHLITGYCMLGGKFNRHKCTRVVSGACNRMHNYDIEHNIK